MALRELREALADRLFEDVVRGRVREAVKAVDDRYWRELNGAAGPKDLSWFDLVERGRDSLEAYRSNPLAFRIVELSKAYVLGRGVRAGAEDPAVDRFVRRWWEHPQNRMDLRLRQWVVELSLSGEVFITLHTNPADGMTYVRAAPASAVDRVETDPQDYERELFYRQALEGDPGGEGRRWPACGPELGLAAGMKHYAVNRVVGAVRGQGDLVPILPWLSRYKEWLTDRVRINRYKGAYLWDVTLAGATDADILAKQAQLARTPSPGSCLVHGEGETWKAVAPDIRAEDVEPDGKAMRLMIAAGGGIPLHFLSEGESATRATAAEMGEPTRRAYEDRQRYVGWMVNDLLAEVVRRAALAGAIPAGADRALRPVEFPDLTAADNAALARAARDVAEALALAEDRGYVERDQAAAAFRLVAGVA